MVFVTGVVVGGLVSTFRGLESPAIAQQPPKAEPGRYMISSWGYGMHQGSGHGAYVLDTQTGEVFIVYATEEPRSVGMVRK